MDLAIALLVKTIKKKVSLGLDFSAAMLINSPEVRNLLSESTAVSEVDDFMSSFVSDLIKKLEETRDKIEDYDLEIDILGTYNDLTQTYNSYVDICKSLGFKDSWPLLKKAYSMIGDLADAIKFQLIEPSYPPVLGLMNKGLAADELPF